jgi:hypothetical protein
MARTWMDADYLRYGYYLPGTTAWEVQELAIFVVTER